MNALAPTGTVTKAPWALVGEPEGKLKVQEKRASARFPLEPLASAKPPEDTTRVPPVFEQVPEKPAYPAMIACGQAIPMPPEVKVFALGPYEFELRSAN